MLPCLEQVSAGVILSVRLLPRASCNQIAGLHEDFLKIKLTSPPVDGAANNACCVFLAKVFKVSRSSIDLVSGHKSRKKKFLLRGTCLKDVSQTLKEHFAGA